MDSENKNIFKCNVCEQSFDTTRSLAIHTSAKYTHDGLQRNELNEIMFISNYCNRTFRSQKSFYNHRRTAKHPLDDVVVTGEAMEPTTEEVQDVYTSNGRIQNEISHEKDRVIKLSTSMALGRVQDAVKQAFRNVHEELIPLYTTTDIEHRDAWERVRKTTKY